MTAGPKTHPRATVYDVAQLDDADFSRSEAICLEMLQTLGQHDVHPAIGIAATSTLLSALLIGVPLAIRGTLTDRLLRVIRSDVRTADAKPDA